MPGGQNHKRGIVAGDGKGKRTSADKGNIARNGKAKTARAAGEGEQRTVVEEGLVHDGLFDFEMGIEGIFLPVRCELEGNLGFRMRMRSHSFSKVNTFLSLSAAVNVCLTDWNAVPAASVG